MACILIIDDDNVLRDILAKALGHAGHTVFQAPDGLQGVDLARVAPVDLVLTDLIMPVQEGVETITTLRKERPELPVIAMSGDTANAKLYLEIAGKIGARRVLEKPFTPAELLALIDQVLSEGGGKQPNSSGPPSR